MGTTQPTADVGSGAAFGLTDGESTWQGTSQHNHKLAKKIYRKYKKGGAGGFHGRR